MLLQMSGICKAFGGAPALRDVDLEVAEGEVHGLVGENGAGKSTLIKILTGVYALDTGEILWYGRPLEIRSPAQSMQAGISVIHQDRALVPGFTAVENAWLGRAYPIRRGRIDWKRMRAEVAAAADALGLEIDLDRTAAELTPPQRTCLEIVRAMMRDCRLLVLDEPTAALTDRESARLFELIDRLKARGTAVIYISHRLDEIFRLTDRTTVLKNGERVLTAPTADLTREKLIAAMTDNWTGGSVNKGGAPGEVRLEVEHLSTRDGRVRDASLTAHAGEVLGVFGLGGSGRTELLECVYGCRAAASGTVKVDGEALPERTPRGMIARGVALICEDRRGKALAMPLSVRENVALTTVEDYARAGVVSDRAQDAAVGAMTGRLGVRMADPGQPVRELSGGNQQKVVFARALMKRPGVLLCDEPTQAVDVRTRHELHALMRAQADAGAAVVFVSSDLKELLEAADRIQVMVRGETRALLENDGLTDREVLAYCYGRG